MRNRSPVIFCAIALALAGAGCGRGPTNGGPVIAVINDYELTAADFERERLSDPIKPKEELLEDIIVKKIMLQEAQKQDFDKGEAFMREIERYWEQALLKLLIEKKTGDFLKEARADTDGNSGESVRKAFRAWVAGLRKKAVVKIDRDALGRLERDRKGGPDGTHGR
jgi:hypothetical protein